MAEPNPPEAAALARAMGIDREDLERRLRFVDFDEADRARLLDIAPLLRGYAAEATDSFFAFLAQHPEARSLFGSQALLARARELKRAHIEQMAAGSYGLSYVAERLELGTIYSRAGIDARVFLGAFQHLMQALGQHIIDAYGADPTRGYARFASLRKVGFVDIGLFVDVLIYQRERLITKQQAAIHELSTPVLRIAHDVLLAPIVGTLDAERTGQLTDRLLSQIRATRARVAVVDVTGMAEIDSDTAARLHHSVAAARLMGARVLITGIASEVARSLGGLGIDFGGIEIASDLMDGLERARR